MVSLIFWTATINTCLSLLLVIVDFDSAFSEGGSEDGEASMQGLAVVAGLCGSIATFVLAYVMCKFGNRVDKPKLIMFLLVLVVVVKLLPSLVEVGASDPATAARAGRAGRLLRFVRLVSIINLLVFCWLAWWAHKVGQGIAEEETGEFYTLIGGPLVGPVRTAVTPARETEMTGGARGDGAEEV